jgi:hypothetical protein
MLWYFETAAPLSNRWTPNSSLVEPRVYTKQGKPDRIGNDIGPRVRGLTEVHPDHHRLTLTQLAAIYGQGGAFYATRPVRAADGSWTTANLDPMRPGYQADDSGNA